MSNTNYPPIYQARTIGARNLMDFSFYSFSWGSAEYQEGGREKNEFSTKAFNGLGMLHETLVQQQQPLEHY